MKALPPKRALRFLRWFLREDYLEEIEGDLTEVFEKQYPVSPNKAKWKFTWTVIKYFRPRFMKSFSKYFQPHALGMYKSYIVISWRTLVKNSTFSLINISGLSLGLLCSMLIALWVNDEYMVDAFHEDLDRIYTITSTEYSGHEITYGGYDTPGLLGEELKKVMPEVEYGCNYGGIEWRTFNVDDKKTKQPGTFAGTDFFRIFSYPLLFGSRETALKSPEGIAISRKLATTLFGSPELAMEKSVRFENFRDLKVTAVFEDLGDNVSERFEYLLSWDFFIERNEWAKDFGNSGPLTFIKLREHAKAEMLIPKLQHFLKGYDKDYSDIHRLELSMQPYGQKYLYSNFKDGKVAGGRIEYVRLFSLVAIFILLIACVNFMNLSTARSLRRAKEIGVRKVNGAFKSSLIGQFMVEAFLLTSIAVMVALVALVVLLPPFNLLTGKNIQAPLTDGRFWLAIMALTVITGFISGSYPALLLSSFKPILVMKQSVKTSSAALFFRKGLVVFQFALSMIFIVGMIVISKQVAFIQSKNLGYEKNNLFYLPISGTLATHFNTFKQEALKVPGIQEISVMSSRPIELENTTIGVDWEGKVPDTAPVFVQLAIHHDFAKTMKATIVMGRDFSEDFADSASYLINEKALRIIGYKDPIGMPLTFWGKRGTIVGVIKDFHFNSLHVPIEPLIIRLLRRPSGYALIRTNPEEIGTALAGLEELHEKLNPEFVFAIQFADEEYAYMYQSEQVINQLSRYFAFLAIFISSLGLLGLIIFTAEQRTKEVGIRKVLGASLPQIASLLSRDFLKLVLVSIVLSMPVAYYLMSGWLKSFEYRISMDWWTFIIAAVGAVVIALLTISFQTIKAALVNPVNSLKAE